MDKFAPINECATAIENKRAPHPDRNTVNVMFFVLVFHRFVIASQYIEQ